MRFNRERHETQDAAKPLNAVFFAAASEED